MKNEIRFFSYCSGEYSLFAKLKTELDKFSCNCGEENILSTAFTIALTSLAGIYTAGKCPFSTPAFVVVIIGHPQHAASITVPARPS